MSDTAPDHIDLDTLTDDEVNALSPEQIQALMDQEESVEEDVLPEEPVVPAADVAPEPVVEPVVDAPKAEPAPAAEIIEDDEVEFPEAAKPADEKIVEPAPVADPSGKAKAEEKPAAPVDDKAKAKEEPKAEDKAKVPNDDGKAADFYAKITAPFKAVGKDFAVKTPEEAIRLMQMGADYSRRMQEIKPLKAQDAMLREHGLNDPAKLSELIDISKGNPAAIQKLLKEKGIDPLDIDVSKDTGYKSPDFQANPKDLAFKDAIETTMAAPGGRELITDMNKTWDEESKQALHDQPTIFENMLAQKETGVYSKINAELTRQRTLGFLTDVPFLQAYHQVGDAMQKAGVFEKPKAQSEEQIAPVVTPAAPAPIDTGTRKPIEKKTQPANPILSSTPPNGGAPATTPNEPDYSSMSDADFAKLGAPS